MADPLERRRLYEAAVLSLRAVADQRRRAGERDEAIARDLVLERNRLKATFRALDDPVIVALM